MWYDQLHWPIASLLLGVAIFHFRRHEKARAIMFFGMTVAALGRLHIALLVVGVIISAVGFVRLRPAQQ